MGPIQARLTTKPQRWAAGDILWLVCVVENGGHAWQAWWSLGLPGQHGQRPCLISQIMNEQMADVMIMHLSGDT